MVRALEIEVSRNFYFPRGSVVVPDSAGFIGKTGKDVLPGPGLHFVRVEFELHPDWDPELLEMGDTGLLPSPHLPWRRIG